MARTLLLTAVLGASLMAPVVVRAQQTPTLGELALKEQARRQALKTAGKVLTNGDLPRTAPRPPVAAPPASDPAAEPKPPDTPEEPPKDEAWWKQRMSQVREELRRNQMFADALQTRLNSLTSDFASVDDPYRRARIADDRAQALVELDRVKGDIELNRKKIAEIEDDARKAAVPPGWLR